jgi:uncharacterized protein YbjT (DUF2867 family)
MTTILVTGATGTVGSKVVRELAGREGALVRAAVRSASAADEVRRARATPVEMDFARDALVSAAVEGVDAVFLVTPSLPDPLAACARFLELAKAAGVRRVVKLSALECDREPTIAFGRAHRDVERLIARSGLAWTFLRPNNFMENFLGLRHSAFAPNARGEIRLPWGDAACSFIAADDIAAVASAVLARDGHEGKTYELTGPEALRLEEIAGALGEATGRTFRYVDVPEDEARQALVAMRLPPPMVEGVLELHALGKAGRAAIVTRTVPELTGRAALTFPVFARAHAATWSGR